MGLETLAISSLALSSPGVSMAWFDPVAGFKDEAAIRQELIEAEVDKEVEKANRKIRRRGKRGRS